MGDIVKFSPKDISLIRRTIAKDCNDCEFDTFMHICKTIGLDPLRRQIYCFVFYRDQPDKRQLTTVVAIDGLRAIANRTGDYRPDPNTPIFEVDEKLKGKTNPHGIVSCSTKVFKFSHGDWFPVAGQAFWDEYVPIVRGEIDKRKTGWVKMPRIMLAKCAEAVALRKAWPEDFGMLYEWAEVDRSEVLDLTPSEAATVGDQDRRLAALGGKDAIFIDWMDGKPLNRVLVKDVAEKIDEFIDEHKEEPMTLKTFFDRNIEALRDFAAREKSDALAVKRRLEETMEKALRNQADV